MSRICTTVDADVDRRLRAEARRRRITRARLLREAAISYLGAAEAAQAFADLRGRFDEQNARLELIERRLGITPEGCGDAAAVSRGSAAARA